MSRFLLVAGRVVLLAAIGALFGCQMYTSGGTLVKGTGWMGGSTAGVSLSQYSFNPSPLTFPAASGVTVTWTNNQDVTHTVTSDTGLFDSGDLAPGMTFSPAVVATLKAGTYGYHCKIHYGMTGTIVVN